MKRPIILMCLGALFASSFMWACATCIGTVEPDSPPFFSDELYQLDPPQAEIHQNSEPITVEENR